MTISAKIPDCVAMKLRVQQELLAEYESRKDEFSTFADFLHAVADESQWIRTIRQKIRRPAMRK